MMTEKRMVAAEQKNVTDLMGAITLLANAVEEIPERRYKMILRGKWYGKTALGLASKLLTLLIRTAPNEQREHFKRQARYMRVICGIRAALPRDPDAAHGRWLSFHELDVVANAIRECCLTCTLDVQHQRQCPYAKLLDVLPTEKHDEDAPGCGYFDIWE